MITRDIMSMPCAAEKQPTYATVESLTGGTLAALLTGINGSSEYFVGGTVAYQECVKQQIGVKDIGAYDSVELAIDLAKCSPIKADVIISTTGYIDRSYAYCIMRKNGEPGKEGDEAEFIAEHVVIPAEQVQEIPRAEIQRCIAVRVLRHVLKVTKDERLVRH